MTVRHPVFSLYLNLVRRGKATLSSPGISEPPLFYFSCVCSGTLIDSSLSSLLPFSHGQYSPSCFFCLSLYSFSNSDIWRFNFWKIWLLVLHTSVTFSYATVRMVLSGAWWPHKPTKQFCVSLVSERDLNEKPCSVSVYQIHVEKVTRSWHHFRQQWHAAQNYFSSLTNHLFYYHYLWHCFPCLLCNDLRG